MHSELTIVPKGQNKILPSVARNFLKECPECGPFFAQDWGHHSSVIQTKLRELIPERYHKRTKARLLPDERRLFTDTVIRGERMPDAADVKRWQGLVQIIEAER